MRVETTVDDMVDHARAVRVGGYPFVLVGGPHAVSKRSISVIITVILVAVVVWLGGRVLWNALLAMHGR